MNTTRATRRAAAPVLSLLVAGSVAVRISINRILRLIPTY